MKTYLRGLAMINFVSPKTGAALTTQGNELVAESGERYPIINGIPRFVESDNYASAFGLQWTHYANTQLDSFTGHPFSKQRMEGCLGCATEDLKGKDVLEAGCGPGRFTEWLVKAGANTHSFDLSVAVDANKKNVGDAANYQIAQADIYQIPFPKNSFDVVMCLGVIQHTPSPEKTIQCLFDMVKPGGMLVIDHYRWRWAYYSTLKPLYRFFLKRMKPERSKRIVEALVAFFFPIQWKVRNIGWLHRLINRFSPMIVYYHVHPELSKEAHYEWAKMDTYDSTTDYYKHLRTTEQIEATLKDIGGKNIWVREGGNGVEARATK